MSIFYDNTMLNVYNITRDNFVCLFQRYLSTKSGSYLLNCIYLKLYIIQIF